MDTVAGSTQSTVGVKKAVRKCVQAIAVLNPNAGTGDAAASVPADSTAASSEAAAGDAAGEAASAATSESASASSAS